MLLGMKELLYTASQVALYIVGALLVSMHVDKARCAFSSKTDGKASDAVKRMRLQFGKSIERPMVDQEPPPKCHLSLCTFQNKRIEHDDILLTLFLRYLLRDFLKGLLNNLLNSLLNGFLSDLLNNLPQAINLEVVHFDHKTVFIRCDYFLSPPYNITYSMIVISLFFFLFITFLASSSTFFNAVT
jgi:hypothetical protein